MTKRTDYQKFNHAYPTDRQAVREQTAVLELVIVPSEHVPTGLILVQHSLQIRKASRRIVSTFRGNFDVSVFYNEHPLKE